MNKENAAKDSQVDLFKQRIWNILTLFALVAGGGSGVASCQCVQQRSWAMKATNMFRMQDDFSELNISRKARDLKLSWVGIPFTDYEVDYSVESHGNPIARACDAIRRCSQYQPFGLGCYAPYPSHPDAPSCIQLTFMHCNHNSSLLPHQNGRSPIKP